MNPGPDDHEGLSRVARALAPFGAQFVVAGGWAHQLHRRSSLAGQVEFDALRTEDLDIATVHPVQAGPAPLDLVLEQAGFRPDPSGDATPPATRYVYQPQPTFYVQFFTQRTGSGVQRDHSVQATVVVAGVVAERLRHVNILLARPWLVELGPAGAGRELHAMRLHVANASCFMAQKLLVLSSRAPADRAKDIVYIYDTLMMFAGSLDELRSLWASVAEGLPTRTARDVVRLASRLCASVSDDIREAVRLLGTLDRQRLPTPEELCAAMNQGLVQVFGAGRV